MALGQNGIARYKPEKGLDQTIARISLSHTTLAVSIHYSPLRVSHPWEGQRILKSVVQDF